MNKALSLAFFGLGCVQSAAWSQAPLQASPSTISSPEAGVSLAALLQLQPAQTQRFERLHDELMARTQVQERKIAAWHEQRMSVLALDAHRAADLERDISGAARKIEADWTATRTKARAMLPPVQLSQLDALASDPRFRVRPDRVARLLMAPSDPAPRFDAPRSVATRSGVTRSGATRSVATGSVATGSVATRSGVTDAEARRNWLDARRLSRQGDWNRATGIGSYGVYGGYGFGGPQAGVYGGYQQGAIGVHGGFGLGGPSIGINIGRVFGIGRR